MSIQLQNQLRHALDMAARGAGLAQVEAIARFIALIEQLVDQRIKETKTT
jgi:hypothetical protein